MKKYFGIFVLALMTSVFSCKKEKEPIPDCSECGNKVEKIQDRKGSINYDSTASRYVVFMYTPGTIDSFIAGFVCDLPEKYRRVGTQVAVSGTLYETTLRYPKGICCSTDYCLALSAIDEK